MSEANEEHPMSKAIALNYERLKVRFEEARLAGAAWLVECRDLYDAFDADAGVYFQPCVSESEVDELVARSQGKSAERVLAIYSLSHPVNTQGVGLKPDEWLAG